MTADQRFALLEVKIKRAEKHFADLNSIGLAFKGTNPYRIATKRDAKTGKLVYYVAGVEPIPDVVYATAGDLIHNLRAVLDHLMWQLTIVSGKRTTETEIHFPIGRDANDYKAKLRGKIQTLLRDDAIDALKSIEAYKGGNGEMLWVLNRLNNIDKHRLLIAVGSSYKSVNIGPIFQRVFTESGLASSGLPAPPSFDLFLRPADICCPLKVGDELFIDTADAKPNDKIQFAFDVAFNEPGVVEGKPIFETLKHLTDLVRNTVTVFKPCLG